MFETLCVASKVLAIIAETIGTLQNAATAGLAAANVNGTLCALTMVGASILLRPQ